MITIKKGNIFTTQCQTIVNTVNCVGIMGAGIALEFKIRHPHMFTAYERYCENGQITIGSLWIYTVPESATPCCKVLNFPTKNHWKDPSSINYLELGLQKFIDTYQQKAIKSIAFPLLGANLGELPEQLVLDTMVRYLEKTDIEVEIWYFSPTAKDDLYDLLLEKLTTENEFEFKKKTGLTTPTLGKIKLALQQPNINAISALSTVKGIGKASIEKLYSYLNEVKRKHGTEETTEKNTKNLSLF
jgi:O-acetyl-ADP-ribose deacetylase (regulator of RNase III)